MDHSEDQTVDGSIILKWNLRKWYLMVCSEFIRIGLGTDSGLL
jgi:hypothetical protein